MTTNLLARHLCGGVVVMHDECRSMLLPTKRIVPILLGAPLLRASDGGMRTLLAIDLCGSSTWEYLRSPRSMAVCLRGERYLTSLLVV